MLKQTSRSLEERAFTTASPPSNGQAAPEVLVACNIDTIAAAGTGETAR